MAVSGSKPKLKSGFTGSSALLGVAWRPLLFSFSTRYLERIDGLAKVAPGVKGTARSRPGQTPTPGL